MEIVESLRWPSRKRRTILDGEAGQGGHAFKMIQLSFMGFLCIVMLFIVFRTTDYLYQQTEIDDRLHPFGDFKELPPVRLDSLPHGIIHPRADLELRSLWSSSNSMSKGDRFSNRSLLAMAVGIGQKDNVDAIVKKFLSDNSTVMLFHYDGNVNGWSDLSWNNSTIHIVAQNQTKWWFAKRFLHPDVVNIYDYIFLWDEDLGVKNFNPRRYLKIVKSEGLEISQPALDPHSTGIHHRITIRKRTSIFHRRMYGRKGGFKCSNSSKGPPCVGWVEVMAPVFSRAAWHCAWNLIQNDLVHGWGLDIKIGYCAQGDRTQKVGIVDSEFIVHQGIETLGGSSLKKSRHFTTILQKVGKARKTTTEVQGQGSNGTSRIEPRTQATRSRVALTRPRRACPSSLGRQGLIEKARPTRLPKSTRSRQALVEIDEAQTPHSESTKREVAREAEDEKPSTPLLDLDEPLSRSTSHPEQVRGGVLDDTTESPLRRTLLDLDKPWSRSTSTRSPSPSTSSRASQEGPIDEQVLSRSTSRGRGRLDPVSRNASP